MYSINSSNKLYLDCDPIKRINWNKMDVQPGDVLTIIPTGRNILEIVNNTRQTTKGTIIVEYCAEVMDTLFPNRDESKYLYPAYTDDTRWDMLNKVAKRLKDKGIKNVTITF